MLRQAWAAHCCRRAPAAAPAGAPARWAHDAPPTSRRARRAEWWSKNPARRANAPDSFERLQRLKLKQPPRQPEQPAPPWRRAGAAGGPGRAGRPGSGGRGVSRDTTARAGAGRGPARRNHTDGVCATRGQTSASVSRPSLLAIAYRVHRGGFWGGGGGTMRGAAPAHDALDISAPF
jgi:hypothetical protein